MPQSDADRESCRARVGTGQGYSRHCTRSLLRLLLELTIRFTSDCSDRYMQTQRLLFAALCSDVRVVMGVVSRFVFSDIDYLMFQMT